VRENEDKGLEEFGERFEAGGGGFGGCCGDEVGEEREGGA